MRRTLAYVPALVWAALLLFVGGRSDVPSVETPLPLDKAAHFVMYGILGILATFGWLRAGHRPRFLWILLLALMVGAIDEYHQRSVPNRSADLRDWLADAVGVLSSASVILRFRKPGSQNVV